MNLPSIGDFVTIPAGVSGQKQAATFAVIARRELKDGAKITMISGGDGFSNKVSTKPIKETPEGWLVQNGHELGSIVINAEQAARS